MPAHAVTHRSSHIDARCCNNIAKLHYVQRLRTAQRVRNQVCKEGRSDSGHHVELLIRELPVVCDIHLNSALG